jgi:phosphoglycolate phosphatase-like HAD superfamily hydrolase
MVGDHDYDIQAAKAIGAMAIRASWHRFGPPEFCSLSDQHFKSVDEMMQWVR